MARKSRWQAETRGKSEKKSSYSTWVYARISTENEKNEDSIDNQIALCREHISSKADLEFAGVFTDSGFTGTNMQRPEYSSMMAGILAGDVRCVVVKDLSRLGRTYIEVGELLFDTFPKYDVRFISVNDRYDSNDEDARRKKLILLFKNLMNHVYSLDLGKKIMATHKIKQQRGEIYGGTPPYGYIFTVRNGRKSLYIEAQSADIVRQIFNMLLDGYSALDIARHLNANNVPTYRNHYYVLGIVKDNSSPWRVMWEPTYIRSILKNDIYTGNLTLGKYGYKGNSKRLKPRELWVVHENMHPAIVSKDMFEEVQEIMAKSAAKYRCKGNDLIDNIFVGKVFCSKCGKSVRRIYSSKSMGRIVYLYHCQYCFEQKKAAGQKPNYIKLETLENIVSEVIQKQVDVCLEIDRLLDDITNSKEIQCRRHTLNTEINRLRVAQDKAGELLSSAYAHHVQGVLDDREFEIARSRFEDNKTRSKSDIARLECELAEYDIAKLRTNECLTHFSQFKGFDKLNRAIIESLIDRIDISPDSKEVSVKLAFQDEYDKMADIMAESGVTADATV